MNGGRRVWRSKYRIPAVARAAVVGSVAVVVALAAVASIADATAGTARRSLVRGPAPPITGRFDWRGTDRLGPSRPRMLRSAVPGHLGAFESSVRSPSASRLAASGVLQELGAVACVSASDCWAVGGGDDVRTNVEPNEALHWNGRKWSHVPVPQPGGSSSGVDDFLYGVACVSASDCWAVGVSEKSDTAPDLNEVLRFNGKKWARVAAPNPGGKAAGDESQLFGVACASASDCWAVGLSRNGSGAAYLNQALRFNGTKWSEVTTPEPGGKVSGDQNELDGVACASASSCWAVGYSQRGSGAAELDQALRFNGKKWSAVTTPEPGGTAADDDSRLLGVTCASASECWAVGYSEGGNAAAERNQALRFNGKQWSTVKTPQPAGESSGAFDALAGVACVSAPDCYAVGGSGNEALRILSNEVQHWNGKTWSAVKPAVVVPSPGEGSLLNSVACAAASDCWAVGYSERKSGADRNEALHWDGKKWSVVATPNPAGKRSGDSDELLGVRCVRASDCWAVGYSQSGRRAADLNEVLQWNGKTWSVVATPDPGGANSGDRNELIGVTCVSASSCWAVGYSQDTGGQLNEALHFNGNAWSVVATPDPGGTDLGDFNVLEGVACASGSRCWAVGYSQSGSSAALNEALRFNGKKWVPGTISDPGGSASGDSNILFGVTCVSASDCWAVGETENASADLNQAFHWNGKSWSLTSTPEPGTGSSPFGNPLNGVACISASDCWAVGYYLNRHSTAVLNEALRWNGEKWSHVATPEPGGKLDVANILLGVSCSSESACRAVGEITPGLELGVNQALHFDGKRWQAG